jgi:hypothetical protein
MAMGTPPGKGRSKKLACLSPSGFNLDSLKNKKMKSGMNHKDPVGEEI